MAEKSTFIKLDRNIVHWRWFKDPKMYQVFSWLIIMANVKNHDFQRCTIHRGEIATSYEKIADGCGLSVSSVRRVIANLEETKEIERVVKDHYQIIKILKYDEYQGCSVRTGKQQPVEQPLEQPVEQATGNNIRIYKNIKNGKNGKKSRSAPVPLSGMSDRPYAEKMKPIDEGTINDIPEEFRDLCETYADYWRLRNR